MLRQAEIGWVNFFHGFVAKEWGIAGTTSEVTSPGVDEQRTLSSETLLTYIAAAQTYTLHLWMSRNAAVLHDAGSASLDIAHATLNNSITQLYNLRATFSAMVQSYFATPLVDSLKQSPLQRRRWLLCAYLATSHSSVWGSRQQHISTYTHTPTVGFRNQLSPLARTLCLGHSPRVKLNNPSRHPLIPMEAESLPRLAITSIDSSHLSLSRVCA
jgi:hypothetical protein